MTFDLPYFALEFACNLRNFIPQKTYLKSFVTFPVILRLYVAYLTVEVKV